MAYTSTSDVVNAAKRILIVVLFLLNIKGGVSQCLIPRVQRSMNYASETSPPPGSNFYVVLGQPVQFFCYCPEYSQFEMVTVEILQGEETIKSQNSCATLLHTITNASYSDEGQYICRANNTNGHTTASSLGNLTIIDPAVVQAGPRQYGQLNTQTKLLCNTSLDINEFDVIFDWFSGQGQTKVAIESSGNGSLIINNAQFTHGGVYTCQVYFGRIDIKIEKIVELVIIVAPPNTTPLPSLMTHPTTTPTPNGQPTTTSSNTTATVTPVESTSVLVTILAVLGTSLAISFILLVVLITYVVLHCFKVHKCYYQSQEEKA